MANQEHLDRLRENSVADFNLWISQKREEDPVFIIDLSKADLSGADLRGANLSEANLFRADLSKANLFRADLSRADLSKANLFRADLRMAELIKANLREAKLFRAIFSSRRQLNDLRNQLDNEQLLSCVILDEKDTDQIEVEEDAPALTIKFTRKNWRPIDIGLAFFSIELMANRLQYLCRNNISENDLEKLMLSPCYPDSRNEGIQVKSIQTGSLDLVLAFLNDTYLVQGGVLLTSLKVIIDQVKKLVETRKIHYETEKIKHETIKLKRGLENKNDNLPQIVNPSQLPEDYQTAPIIDIESIKWPVNTLSQVNGINPEKLSEHLTKGMSSSIVFFENQIQYGFDIITKAERFDPKDFLHPDDY